jgi:hypothetical protein
VYHLSFILSIHEIKQSIEFRASILMKQSIELKKSYLSFDGTYEVRRQSYLLVFIDVITPETAI